MSSLDSVGGHDRARKIAQSFGYDTAEEFKALFVDDSAVSWYDMKYDKDTKEIVLVNKTTKAEERTGFYLKN